MSCRMENVKLLPLYSLTVKKNILLSNLHFQTLSIK
jgi:hypothetical protein